MKAILVIDEMPKMCIGCPLNLADSSIKCRHTWTVKAIPSWCPLRPMPEKADVLHGKSMLYEAGWNACIEEIEK